MSPRLILHIGQPKTGTTTLQKSLQASRPALADDNILHPCTGLHHNHRVLLPYLADKGPAFSNAKSIKASRLAWNGVLHDSRNTMPKIIIISSEQFYHVADDNAVKNILSHLYSLSEELVISCYVREPASSALSRFQQNIKRTPKFKLRSNSYYRDTLESYLNKCPESLRVREFNRRTLRRGDIVGDFFSSHIPHFDQDKITRVKNANTTMSAEAMALMQEINREERSLPTASALKTIVKVDREIGGYSRPRMHTQIRQAIQARCTDLSWLEDKFGIVFPNINPESMSVERANQLCDALDQVTDVCPVDIDRKKNMWSAATALHSSNGRLADKSIKKPPNQS